MSKHTPGPWTVVAEGPWVCGPAGQTVALVQIVRDEPEMLSANARLVAAAPELLEALKAISEGCHQWMGREINAGQWLEIQAQAAAAIEKAEGR